MTKRILSASIIVLLSACSVNQMPIAPRGPTIQVAQRALPPKPWSPGEKIGRFAGTLQPMPARPHFSPPRTTKNITGHDHGGQGGFQWPYNANIFHGNDGEMEGEATAYEGTLEGGTLSLPTPVAGAVTQNILDSPTSHSGGVASCTPNVCTKSVFGCIEDVTSYSNGFQWIGKTKAQVQIFDFCINNFASQSAEINASFVSNYVRDYGDGLPTYLYEEVYNGRDVIQTTAQLLLLYNATSGSWDQLYSTPVGGSQVSSRTDGWSNFETHYGATSDNSTATEPCPGLPQMKSEGIELHKSMNESQFGSWYYVDPNNLTSNPPGAAGDCFNTPLTSPYYAFSWAPASQSNAMYWNVMSH